MPVTRSSSRPNSLQPPNPPYLTGPSGSRDTKKSSDSSSSNEIIVLSSDDDEPRSKGNASQKKTSHRPLRRKAGTSAAVAPVPSGDVLEISSDEETQPKRVSPRKHASSSETTIKDLQRAVKKLQEELRQSEERLAFTSREVEELKHDCNKDVLSGLEEYTSCEVCTLTMWCPYVLPECGHSFCQNCLVNWFSKTQAQHMTANPQLDNSRAALAGQLHTFVQMVPNLHAYGPHGQHHVRAVLAELRRHRPEYSCPSCRKEVLSKPIEDFRLKGFIKEIAGRMGEHDSHKDTFRHRGSGPFDHFFAAPISAR